MRGRHFQEPLLLPGRVEVAAAKEAAAVASSGQPRGGCRPKQKSGSSGGGPEGGEGSGGGGSVVPGSSSSGGGGGGGRHHSGRGEDHVYATSYNVGHHSSHGGHSHHQHHSSGGGHSSSGGHGHVVHHSSHHVHHSQAQVAAGGSGSSRSRSERAAAGMACSANHSKGSGSGLGPGLIVGQPAWLQRKIHLRPQHRGVHLVTEEILRQVRSYSIFSASKFKLFNLEVNGFVPLQLPELSQFAVGLMHIQLLHTSASLAINENWDPDVRDDMEMMLNRIVPEDVPFRHSCEGPDDMVSIVGGFPACLLANGLFYPSWNSVTLTPPIFLPACSREGVLPRVKPNCASVRWQTESWNVARRLAVRAPGSSRVEKSLGHCEWRS